MANASHQLALFEPEASGEPSDRRIVTDDARGLIEYRRGLLTSDETSRFFAELRRDVAWNSGRRVMYEREVDVPRLTSGFRLDGADESRPPALLDIGRRVREALGVAFTNVGLNLYRDGRDSVAPHNDHLGELVRGFPIALVSLGATRRMSVRSKAEPRRSFHLDLEDGSLLVMGYETQVHYVHGIPKTSRPVGERISLAYRVRLDPERVWKGYGFSSPTASSSRETSASLT